MTGTETHAGTSKGIAFGVLGPLEAHRTDAACDLGGPKQRTVLAVLLASAGRHVSTSELIDAVYGEEAPDGARRSVQTYVSNLRSELGEVIVGTRNGYVAEIARSDLDATRFQDAVAAAHRVLDHDPEVAADRLREALGLWRGHPYTDVDGGATIATEITRLEELRLVALEARIDADLALGHHELLIPELDALTGEYPYRERLRAQHMLALYRSGRQAEALRAFQTTRRALTEELGIEPAPDLRALEQQILEHDERLSYRPPPSVGRRALVAVDVDAGTLDRVVPPPDRVEYLVATDAVVRDAIRDGGGEVFAQRLNATFASFADLDGALAAVDGLVRRAPQIGGGADRALLRVAVDVGDVVSGDAGVLAGPVVTRIAGLVSMAHPGQVLVSRDAHSDATAGRGRTFKGLGAHPIPRLDRTEAVFQLVLDGVSPDFPALRTDRSAAISGGMRSMPGYELREQVARGPAGSVWRAYQPSVGREVAIKVISPELANTPEFVRRFELEALTVARLEHPHIVPLFDYWRDLTGAYLVSRWIAGGSLAARMAVRSLDLGEASRLVAEVGSALEAAHRSAVAHGEVSADTILVDPDGSFYIADFGVALADRTSSSDDLVARDVAGLIGTLTAAVGEAGPAADAIRRLLSSGQTPTTISDLRAAWRVVAGGAGAGDVGFTPSRNPYRGLEAFSYADSEDFYGRDAVIGQILDAVDSHRLVAVVGPSGVGKSSVVHAGVLPAVVRGEIVGAEGWFIAQMTPGSHPFEACASALLRVSPAPVPYVDEELAEGDRGLLRAMARMFPENAQVLIVIDQFEELFTLTADAEKRHHFLRSLATLVTDDASNARVVATIRADFFDQPLMHPQFGAILRRATVPLSAPTADELREIIERPAAGVGVAFEAGLVDRMVAEVGEEPGRLPLLEYALAEMFARRSSDLIAADTYAAIGGVLGALGRRAESIFSELGVTARTGARQMFLRLATITDAERIARRRVRRSELERLEGEEATIGTVIDSFARHRLLTLDRDPLTHGPSVEVAHEAMFTEWGRLSGWIDERRSDLAIRRRLVDATDAWDAAGRDPSMLAGTGLLAHFAEWAASTDLSLTQSERAFLDASRHQLDAGTRRALRRRRVAVGAVVLAALVAIVFAFAARAATHRAQLLAAEAMIGDAQGLLATGEYEEAAIGVIESHRLNETLAPLRLMGDILNGNEVWGTALGPTGGTAAVRVGVDWSGGVVAVAGSAPGIELLNLSDGASLGTLETPSPVTALDFIAPGRLVTGDELGNVVAWTIEDGSSERVAYLGVRISAVIGMGDGIVVATQSGGIDTPSRLLLYRPATQQWVETTRFRVGDLPTDTLPSPNTFVGVNVTRLVAAENGERLIAVGDPMFVAAFSVQSGALLGHHYALPSGAVWGVAVSPDGETLVTTHQDRTVWVRDASTLEPLDTPPAQVDAIQRRATFLPDGAVVTSGQTGLLIWRIDDGRLATSPQFVGATTGLFTHSHDLSPDGRRAIAAVGDRVRLYRMDRGLSEHPVDTDDPYRAIAADREVAWLAGKDGGIYRVDLASGESTVVQVDAPVTAVAFGGPVETALFGTFDGRIGRTDGVSVYDFSPAHDGIVWALEWSPAGDFVASAGDDGTIVVRDPSTLAPVIQPFGVAPAETPNGFKALAFLDEDTLATAGRDGMLRIWNIAERAETQSIAIVDNQVNAVVSLPDGNVAVGDEQGAITVVDHVTGEIVTAFSAHEVAIRALAVSDDGRTLASSGGDDTTRLWAIESFTEVGAFGHEGAVRALAFIDDGRLLAGDNTGALIEWSATWWDWPNEICRWMQGWDVARSWPQVMGAAAFDPACGARPAS